MEQQDEQIDPNLNADAYRNLSAADQPPINDRQLEVVVTHKGKFLGYDISEPAFLNACFRT